MHVAPYLRHEKMISWQPIWTRGRTDKDCMSLMLMHNLIKSILRFADHDLWISVPMPIVQYPFFLGKISFPTIVSSWLHNFPMKELSCCTSMAFGPWWRTEVAVRLQGADERARETHSYAESGLREALKGAHYKEHSSCLYLKGVSELYLAWKQLKINTGWHFDISVVISQVCLHEIEFLNHMFFAVSSLYMWKK